MKDFESLGLSEEILKAIQECRYTTPTPIQEKVIPFILMMRDVVGLAQTGTGKTAGFTLPMIDILSDGRAKAKMPRSLILSPTRELAAQIADNFEQYGKYQDLNMALLVGGGAMGDQLKKLDQGVDVLIATPGRLIDLFERGAILLTDIKILVIDEADRMLDMGFIPDIEKIVALLPSSRQTMLFSATMPPTIRKLTEKFLNNPKEISVSPLASTAEKVEQQLVFSSPRNKKDTLVQLIEQEAVKNAFIFCNRKKDIDTLYRSLKKEGLEVGQLHGDMSQPVRTETLEKFKSGDIIYLVCSDVVARGIDIQGVSHVFNYDVPMNPDDYVHRIGRTGRAGQSGRALTLATDHDEKYLQSIYERIGWRLPVRCNDLASPGKDHGSDRVPHSSPKKSAAKFPKAKSHTEETPIGFGEDVPDFFKVHRA